MKLWTLLFTMLLLSLCLPGAKDLFAGAETPATQKISETKKTELSRFTEIIDIFTVNPDGSCKVEYDFKMPLPETPTNQNADESGKNDPYAWVKIFARSMLKSKTIDAWTDLSLEITKDNKSHIKGAAYSKDFLLSVSHIGLTAPTWKENDKGEMVLQIVSKSNKHDIQTVPAELTKEQMDSRINDIREEYKNGIRDKILLSMGTVKHQMVFKLPGNISRIVGFTKNADGSVKWDFDGKKYMDILDKLIADDKEMSKMLKEGRTPFATPLNENMCEALFGTKGLFQAVVTGEMKPQFDYKAEMEKAKAAMPEMIKALKLDD